MRKIYTDAGATILDMPNYVFVEFRDGYWITVNYTSETVTAPVPPHADIVIGGREVAPGGVSVWKK